MNKQLAMEKPEIEKPDQNAGIIPLLLEPNVLEPRVIALVRRSQIKICQQVSPEYIMVEVGSLVGYVMTKWIDPLPADPSKKKKRRF